MIKILSIAGARPNFMKVAPLIRATDEVGGFEHKLVHTGQHYDDSMSQVFFDDLGIPEPFVNLEVGPGARADQIDRIMSRFEPVLKAERPHLVLVVGDVNSTVACARVARAHDVQVVHVEAGLRSFDREMPEELNRVETDQLSNYLFVTEPSGMENLAREEIGGKAYLVGNVMIDTLVRQLPKARALNVRARFNLERECYLVATFHRPSNVDSKERLQDLISLLEHATRNLPLVLPMHPRTRASLQRHALWSQLESLPGLTITEPLGYLEFLSLVSESRAVVTDSGGIQEETTYLRVPCVTMRDNTERPITVDVGSNVLAGSSAEGARHALDDALNGEPKRGRVPELWDGGAGVRVATTLKYEFT